MKRVKGIAILCACLLALLSVGYAYASSSGIIADLTGDSGTGQTSIQQSVARLGSLIVSTSGAGTLVAVSETSLGFQESGVLVEMNVKAGTQVKAGEVLARLQLNKTPNELAAEVAQAELAVVEAQQALDKLYDNASLEAAQALSTLEAAQQSLAELQNNDLEVATAQQALAEAQQAVADAVMQVYILNSSPSQEAMNIAHASLLFKEKELRQAEKRLARLKNQIKNAPNNMVRDMLKRQLLNMNIQLAQVKADYENRLYAYNHMQDPADPVELAVAQAELTTAKAQLAQAQQDLENVQAGASQGDLATAESALAVAQADWESWKDGPDPEELAMAEAQLTTVQANLAMLKSEKLVVDLVAPFDGTVMSVNATQGDRISGETILTLADISQPLVKVYLDESDLDHLQVGNKAEIVLDAFPNRSYTGQVVEINRSLADLDGVDMAEGLVLMDEVPSNNSQSLPTGLTATVDIISAQVDNAVLVPLEALHETGTGEYVVYVIQGEQVEARPVSIGISDYTTVEITEGLAAGEAVALGELPNLKGEQ